MTETSGHSGPPDFLPPAVSSLFGSYDVVSVAADTFTVNMDTVLQDGSPLMLVGTLTDKPGFTHRDLDFSFGNQRERGGSSLEFSLLGSVWVFEKRSSGVISIQNSNNF